MGAQHEGPGDLTPDAVREQIMSFTNVSQNLDVEEPVNGPSPPRCQDGNQASLNDESCSTKDVHHREPIAIIGCAMRLPGGVQSGEAFWNLLANKMDGRCRVPEDRYNTDAYYRPGKAGSVASEYGYFLNDIDPAQADAHFWSMTAREIAELDPQQRLLLEVAYETLQNSGTTKWKDSTIGVYVGCFGEDWAHMQAQENQDLGMYRVTGFGEFAMANRISYELGLTGPSMTIRTACSSSLTGLHEACIALQTGECDSAIIAGTNMILDPQMTASLTAQGVLSPQGHARSFDDKADGYVRGEAVVAIQVKKLSDAIRCNDPIRAVIRASCVNSDGKTAGLSQPSPESHAVLMRRSHALAGITDLSKTAMIECHGTGTQVGDPLEAGAVASVFGDHGIFIGSVKPNVGHSEGASGITSVIKMMLALEHKQIPPNIKFESPNRKIPFEKTKLKVPTDLTPWPADRFERVGVNSYGIGGANAHVLLESATCAGVESDHPTQKPKEVDDMNQPYLLTFSAHTSEALRMVFQAHESYLTAHPDRLPDLSYTLTTRREPLGHRAFTVVQKNSDSKSVEVSQFHKCQGSPLVAWVFTGQGAQWARMGASLILKNDGFKRSIELLEMELQNCNPRPKWSLIEEILKSPKESRLSTAEFSQPICTAVQVALVDVLKSWAIRPSAVVGHSSGEIAAAYASGMITAIEAIRIAYYRGQATKGISAQDSTANSSVEGGMAAVGLGRQDVEPFLVPGVLIGCENSPSSVTLSGDSEPLAKVMKDIQAAHPDALVRQLHVDCAYHSHHMESVSSLYAAMLPNIQPRRPSVPFYSSVLGELLDAKTSLDGSYWVRNLVSPVLFSGAVSGILKDLGSSSLVFLELGPHSALAGPVRQIIRAAKPNSATEYVPTLVRNEDAVNSLLTTAGRLFQLGVGIDFSAVSPKGRVLTDLPTYPWQRSGHFWSENRLSKARRLREHATHDILGIRVEDVPGSHPTWRNMLRLENVPWIRDHQIESDIIFPAAGYICMAGEAIRQLHGTTEFTVREVNIMTGLSMQEGQVYEVISSFTPVRLTTQLDSVWYNFEISSLRGDTWVRHATGQVRSESDYAEAKDIDSVETFPREVGRERWYADMKRAGLNYTGRFRGLGEITAHVRENRASAVVKNTMGQGDSPYSQHPSTIDLVFQLFSVASSKGLSRDFSGLAVPTYIGQLHVRPVEGDMQVTAETEITSRGVVHGHASGLAGGSTVLRLENLRMTPLADAQDSRGEDPHAAAELVWKPDINFLDVSSLMQPKFDHRHLELLGDLGCLLEKMALACICEASERVRDLEPAHGFMTKLRGWLGEKTCEASEGTYPMVADCRRIAQMTSRERLELISDIDSQVQNTEIEAVAAALRRVAESCQDIFTGKEDAVTLLAEDDVLSKIYDLGRITDFSPFFDLAAHYKPNLKILEIGAGTGGTTNMVLPILKDDENNRMYYSYTVTDVSAGFFVAAKERFKDYEALEYRVLDITTDPIQQGFEANSYDLVIASNVIHATPSVVDALSNVRKLLAPKGRLFLQEICPPTKWINFIMGFFPGWWLGGQEGRTKEPYLTTEKWDEALKSAGFGGLEAVHRDEQFNNNMVAVVPNQPTTPGTVSLVCTSQQLKSEAVLKLQEGLASKGQTVELCPLGELPEEGGEIISVVDEHHPFFHDIHSAELEWFKRLVSTSAESKSSILWVTGASQVQCTDPRYAMTLGVARAVRSETELDFATLEIDNLDNDGRWQSAVVDCWVEFQACRAAAVEAAAAAEDRMKPNLEWALTGGKMQIGRFHWKSVNRQLSLLPPQDTAASCTTNSPRRLAIGKPGLLKTLHWVKSNSATLSGDLVRVTNCAVGLNYKGMSPGENDSVLIEDPHGPLAFESSSKRVFDEFHEPLILFLTASTDVLISMGVVDGQGVNDEGLGCECAGIIEETGPDVTSLTPGDRVMVLAIGAISTSVVTSAQMCVKIPDSMSFTEAATMPTVYSTVVHSLLDKARLEAGQSVLIHSACGGVGIAAMQICRMVGAEVYCTVGSDAKVDYLVAEYSVPRDRIFKSRDLTFHRDIMHATRGRGVDVVLNSLSGELLHASWKCVAPYGCMVEIGKRDLIGHGSLGLEPFEQNRSYFGVEISRLSKDRPAIIARVLRDIVKYYRQGHVSPIQPITNFEAVRIEDAMRLMQTGSHTGKIVVNMPASADDLPATSGRPALQLRIGNSYILVGGLGGLGQAIAIYLAAAGAREIIFLSRSATISRHGKFVRELEALGCSAILVAGSVNIKDDVRRAVKAATHPIKGLLQMSMVLNDINLAEMTFDSWSSTVDTKVLGTWNLHEVLLEESQAVDFFIMFSSYSGLVGHWGQANYAAANTFLDAFTQYRHSLGLASATVDVGVMEDIGYVSQKPEILSHFHKTCTHVLRDSDLMDAIHLLIARGGRSTATVSTAFKATSAPGTYVSKDQLILGVRSTQRLDAPHNRTVWKHDRRMAAYRNIEGGEGASASGTVNDELKEFLANVARDPSSLDDPASAEFLARQVGRTVLGFVMQDVGDGDDVDVTQSLRQMGVDSLVAMEVRNWIRQMLSLEIPVMQLMEAPSLLNLGSRSARLLKERLVTQQPDQGRRDYLETKMP